MTTKTTFNYRSYIMLGSLILLWVVFYFFTDGVFLNARNFSNLMRQTAIVGILAAGMVLVIVAGYIDLSVGSMVALTGGVAGMVNVWLQFNAFTSIVIATSIGLALGAFNGWLIAYKKIPAFIVTLGGMLVYRGVIKGSSGGETVGPLSGTLKNVGTYFLPAWMSVVLWIVAAAVITTWCINTIRLLKAEGKPFRATIMMAVIMLAGCSVFIIILNQYRGVPVQVLLLLVISAAITFMATQIPFGRYVYAIGGNKDAAFYSGINISKHVFFVFIIMGALSAVAGLIYTAQLGNATANAGRNLELDAIAACVIGGTSLLGGKGTIPGALLGALIMASLDNGMSLMNIQDYIQDIIKGTILVLAVWLDVSSGAKSN